MGAVAPRPLDPPLVLNKVKYNEMAKRCIFGSIYRTPPRLVDGYLCNILFIVRRSEWIYCHNAEVTTTDTFICPHTHTKALHY